MTTSAAGSPRRAGRRSWLILAAALVWPLAGCHKRPATHDDCVAVIDRLVALELIESGFRDPVVQHRWTDELRRQLAPHLSRCEGRRVPDDLQPCLAGARTAEDIEHHCLR